jgi:uncharacterized protein (DUF4415 family)
MSYVTHNTIRIDDDLLQWFRKQVHAAQGEITMPLGKATWPLC